MNSDDSLPPPSASSGPPPLDPALEARIAAWVLGEASDAESAALARLCAEQPAAEAFRRQLAETHGLLADAVRPASADLRLAPERRAKLLAALAANAAAAHAGKAPPSSAVFPVVTPRRWTAWALPAAACLALLGLLAAIVLPTVEHSFGVASAPVGRVERVDLAFKNEAEKQVFESAITPGDRLVAAAPPSSVAAPAPVTAPAAAANQPLVSFRLDAPATPPPAPAVSEPSGSTGAGFGLASGARRESVSSDAKGARPLEPVAGETLRRQSLRAEAVAKEKPDFVFRDQSNAAPADGYSGSFAARGTVVDELRQDADIGKNIATVSFKPAAPMEPSEWDAPTAAPVAASSPPVAPPASSYANFDKQRDELLLEQSQRLLRQGDTAGAKEALDAYIVATSSNSEAVADKKEFHELPKDLAGLSAKGRSQYAAGAIDEAQETFRTMETVSADNAEAKYFLKRIADDKARIGTLNREKTRGQLLEEVAKSWQRPGVFGEKKSTPTTSAAPVSTADTAVLRKLDTIIIPSISFSGVDFGQAISALTAAGEEYDGAGSPDVPIVIASPDQRLESKVNISLRNMSLRRVLDILTENAGRRYEIRDGVVHILPLEPAADAPKPAPRPAPDASLRLDTPTAENSVSTFSLHVSDASFRLARAALARGEFPDPAAVRPEEFYNAFDYGDPAPRAGEPVAARVEQAAHPFLQQRNLLRVALRVPAAGRSAGQPLRLTLLLDTSGSMEREDRAATVRAALEQLAALLGPADRVTLVGFARGPRLLADRLPGDQAASLAKIAADTPPEGGTNLEAALALAADLALRQFDSAAQNRVVLLTDGAANLGDADPAALSARVVALRQKGVAFDACGVGANGLDDGVLEALTRQGDGRYLLLDNAAEAGPAFARQLAGAFRPAAQNVKVQVRFNPSRVPRYRLIGFEQHRLREQDFRNDKVDAAELAAAEAAVALYQVEVDPQGSGELGEVFVRFRETATGRMIERSWPLPYDATAPAFDRASPSLQLAGASALLAEKLRGGDLAAQIRLADLDPVAAALRGAWAGQPRVAEFLDMLAQARRLAPE